MYLDRERPTAAQMLAPTLCDAEANYLIGMTEHGIAVLALHGEEWADDEFDCACMLHAALERGVLVVAV